MVRIVVNVSGGIVQDVIASGKDVEVVVVDWDVEGSDDDAVVETLGSDGREISAFVSVFSAEPLESLAGTDAQIVLQKAGVADAATRD